VSESRKPAEVFPVGHFITEEMEARAWTKDDLLDRMPGPRGENDFIVECSVHLPDEPGLLLGDVAAERLAHAFGTSKELWLNLDAAYRAFLSKGTK
jgi:plasmid maintenance system antidote protein VapI